MRITFLVINFIAYGASFPTIKPDFCNRESGASCISLDNPPCCTDTNTLAFCDTGDIDEPLQAVPGTWSMKSCGRGGYCTSYSDGTGTCPIIID
jgi:hypothetical protein